MQLEGACLCYVFEFSMFTAIRRILESEILMRYPKSVSFCNLLFHNVLFCFMRFEMLVVFWWKH